MSFHSLEEEKRGKDRVLILGRTGILLLCGRENSSSGDIGGENGRITRTVQKLPSIGLGQTDGPNFRCFDFTMVQENLTGTVL